MATIVDSPASAVAWMMVGSLGTACSDVVVDSIVVERSRGEPQASTSPVWNAGRQHMLGQHAKA